MKIDKEVQEEIVGSLRTDLQEFKGECGYIIAMLGHAPTPNEWVRQKSRLLQTWISGMPVMSESCYFCAVEHNDSCADCVYADTHGVCQQADSDWKHLVDAKRAALRAAGGMYNQEAEYASPGEDPTIDASDREAVRVAIDNRLSGLVRDITSIINVMEAAQTVERFMDFKALLQRKYIKHMPLDRHCCYFCQHTDMSCDICRYGKIHGMCTGGVADDDYYNLCRTVNKLKQHAREMYRGETYEQGAESDEAE